MQHRCRQLTPDFSEVQRFHRAASMHLEAARILLSHCPNKGSSALAFEVIYLSGYVAECILKALILSYTPPARHKFVIEERFKNPKIIGHNLESIALELQRLGRDLPGMQRLQLQRIRSQWSSQMRYSVERKTIQEAKLVLQSSIAIFDWVAGKHGAI